MQQLNDIYFKYQILLFYLFPTFLELQIYSQEQILQIFNDYLTISQEPLQICKIRLDIWIPRPNLPLYTHFWIFIVGSGRVFCIFLLSHSCCPKMDCRSEISRKMRTWQHPIILSYLYLIHFILCPFGHL